MTSLSMIFNWSKTATEMIKFPEMRFCGDAAYKRDFYRWQIKTHIHLINQLSDCLPNFFELWGDLYKLGKLSYTSIHSFQQQQKQCIYKEI